MQLRWQWLLVADEAWWVQAAGGKLSVIPKVGFNPTVCEAVYLKYMDNVPGLSREVLWLVLSYFKRGPRQGAYDDISPRQRKYGDRWARHLIHCGVQHLVRAMVEISPEHLLHPSNHIPHFPGQCVGSVDTFPVHVACGPSRYQPKYAGNVAKFQAFVTHLGLYAYLSGPHPGAMQCARLLCVDMTPYSFGY